MISVAYKPGLTVEELANASRFPHRQIGVSTSRKLIAAGALEIRQSPGRNPVHGDIIVPCGPEGTAASMILQALASMFEQQLNPSRLP